MNARPEWRLKELSVGRGRGVPADRAQVGGKYFRVVGAEILEHGQMAAGNNRGINLIAPEHFERLALSVVIDAGETSAGERVSPRNALHKPPAGAHLNEIAGSRYARGTLHSPFTPQTDAQPSGHMCDWHLQFIVASSEAEKNRTRGAR
jgi:hypothetical protein